MTLQLTATIYSFSVCFDPLISVLIFLHTLSHVQTHGLKSAVEIGQQLHEPNSADNTMGKHVPDQTAKQSSNTSATSRRVRKVQKMKLVNLSARTITANNALTGTDYCTRIKPQITARAIQAAD